MKKILFPFLIIVLASGIAPDSILPAQDNSGLVSTSSLLESVDTVEIMRHIDKLADDIGVRVAGSESENAARDYIASELESFGYAARASEPIPMHNGLTTRNVWAELPGVRDEVMLVGAHYDTKNPSPGANDNGSGVAVVLELARVLSNTRPPYTIHFVFFGAEEIIDGNSDHHHYGSRYLAENAEFVSKLHSVTSVDMVGVGSELWIDNMGVGPDSWRIYLADKAREMEIDSKTGEKRAWSDHEAFEHKGVPVAWVHWRYDNQYHKAGDTSDRIDEELLLKTARFILASILEVEGDKEVEVGNLSNMFAF